jgi:hypothetical protein
MNHEEELDTRIRELEIENGEFKGRVQIAEKQVAEAKVAVQTYINEIQRTAGGVKEMLKNTALIQEQGTMVRRRLAKVQMTLVAADNLINAYRWSYSIESVTNRVREAEEAYTKAREELKKTDGEPDNSTGEQQSASGLDAQTSHDRR